MRDLNVKSVRITSFESTPNPNAIKCELGGGDTAPLAGGAIRSYRTREEAATDPLAVALFAIDGVTNVLITSAWFTVGKRPEVEWKSLKPKIKRAVERWGNGDGIGGGDGG